MKSRRSVDTELLYRGNHIPGIAELPDTPPIYHATAYAVKDTDDYDRANRGENIFIIGRRTPTGIVWERSSAIWSMGRIRSYAHPVWRQFPRP